MLTRGIFNAVKGGIGAIEGGTGTSNTKGITDSGGIYELLIDPESNTVWHFLFRKY